MRPAQLALGFSKMRIGNFRAYLIVAIFSLVYGTLRFSSTLQAAHILDRRDRVDLATLHLQGEFVESDLGAARSADGSVTIHMIAEKYVFVPACVTVPAGVPVRLRITSADSAHGFKIAGSEVKTVPGSVTEIHLLFSAADKYEFYCDEFCGPGHHAMMGRIVAVPENQFQPQNSARGVACGQP
jgi:cytochrome c oxidase subunit 2